MRPTACAGTRAAGSSSVASRPATRRARRAGAGFTLIEILVALAIVAIALGALVVEGSHYVAGAARMQDRTLAHWVAMNRVAEQQLAGTWPSAGTSNGTVELAGREWAWTLRISETPDENVRRIDVEVRADRAGERVDATAIAYLERPAP